MCNRIEQIVRDAKSKQVSFTIIYGTFIFEIELLSIIVKTQLDVDTLVDT